MNDSISRASAVAGLYAENFEQYFDSVFDDDFKRFRRAVIRMLAALPPANDYCPNCGTKMERSEDAVN